MPLPATLSVINLRCTYYHTDGAAATGTVDVISEEHLVSSADGAIVEPTNESVELDENGFFNLTVPATNDPQWGPQNYTYLIKENLSTGVRSYRIAVPYNTPGGILNLASVSPVVNNPAPSMYVLQSQANALGGWPRIDATTGKILESVIPDDIGGTPINFWSGASYAEATGAEIFMGPADPGVMPVGSEWVVVKLSPDERAIFGWVGFMGDPTTLRVLNSGDSFVGTVFEGTATGWDTGNLLIRGDNLIVDGYRINAPVVQAGGKNLTIKNSIVHAGPAVGGYGVSCFGSDRGTFTIQDCSVYCDPGPGLTVYGAGIISDAPHLNILRNYVSGSGDGIHAVAQPGNIENSPRVEQNYVDNLAFPDATQHCDGIQIYNGELPGPNFMRVKCNYVAIIVGSQENIGVAANAAITCGKAPADDNPPQITFHMVNNYFPSGTYHVRIGRQVTNSLFAYNYLGSLSPGGVAEAGFVSVDVPGSVPMWYGNTSNVGDVPNPNP